MISDIDKVDTGDAPGVSAGPPGIADTKHGSAAGSVPRTTDDAAHSASRHVPPLGQGIINEDAAPPERSVVW